jgi:hypothetical protein
VYLKKSSTGPFLSPKRIQFKRPPTQISSSRTQWQREPSSATRKWKGKEGNGEYVPTTCVPMATATMAWEVRKAAACGCIGRAEAPRRPPAWRRSRCCTVAHSMAAALGIWCAPASDLPGSVSGFAWCRHFV